MYLISTKAQLNCIKNALRVLFSCRVPHFVVGVRRARCQCATVCGWAVDVSVVDCCSLVNRWLYSISGVAFLWSLSGATAIWWAAL